MTLQKNNSDKRAEAAELAAIRNLLDKTEKQRDELLKALELADDDIQYYGNSDFNKTLIEIRAAITKAKGE
jgi:hypothetical protein